MEQPQAPAPTCAELARTCPRTPYLGSMNWVLRKSAFTFLCTGFFATTGIAQEAAKDSIQQAALVEGASADSLNADSLPVDSARAARMAVQAELSREISALSSAQLGSETYAWTHLATFQLKRAGQVQTQVFWYNPKAPSNPLIWQLEGGSSEAVFYLDAASGRAATLHLNSLSGSFIPARIASQAGFTGNQSEYLPKKSTAWKAGNSGNAWSMTENGFQTTIELDEEKDAARAQVAFDWMRIQPIEAVQLPFEAKRHPILSMTRRDAEGKSVYELTWMDWQELEEPLVIDATELTISDPERDLHTIAREWAAEKKAKEAAE